MMGKNLPMTRLLLTTLSRTEWMMPAEIMVALPVKPSVCSLWNSLLRLTRIPNAPLRRRLRARQGSGPQVCYEYIIAPDHPFPPTQRVSFAEVLELGGEPVVEPVKAVSRPCLSCQRPFLSEGIHNRLCGRCSSQ